MPSKRWDCLKAVIKMNKLEQLINDLCPEGVEFYNPAFDVTPAELISGIITEHGTVAPGELKQFQAKQLV